MAINFGLTCRVMMKEIPKKNKSTKIRSENEEKDKGSSKDLRIEKKHYIKKKVRQYKKIGSYRERNR